MRALAEDRSFSGPRQLLRSSGLPGVMDFDSEGMRMLVQQMVQRLDENVFHMHTRLIFDTFTHSHARSFDTSNTFTIYAFDAPTLPGPRHSH